MVEHPLGLNIEQNKAFLERVFWHMVGIVNLVHDRREIEPGRYVKSQQIGTGSACEFDRVEFILTAKHVVEGSGIKDLAFLAGDPGLVDSHVSQTGETWGTLHP